MNVIMKFGGTSVQDAEAMNRVINIVRRQWADNPGDRPRVPLAGAGIDDEIAQRDARQLIEGAAGMLRVGHGEDAPRAA